MLDPIAGERQGCCSSMSSSGTTSGEAEDIFPVCAHIYTPQIYICTQLATQITEVLRALTNTDGTNGLILLPSLAERQWKSTNENIYVRMYKVASSSGWAQTLSLLKSCPWMPVSPVAGTCSP